MATLPEIILLNVRWYCRPLSYRDLEEIKPLGVLEGGAFDAQ